MLATFSVVAASFPVSATGQDGKIRNKIAEPADDSTVAFTRHVIDRPSVTPPLFGPGTALGAELVEARMTDPTDLIDRDIALWKRDSSTGFPDQVPAAAGA
jgi:hypothetical protein